MNGRTRLPSLEVPSANSTMVSPCARRVTISPAACPTAVRRVRSTNTDRCNRANDETNGQVPTSFLATNETGATADSTGISSHVV